MNAYYVLGAGDKVGSKVEKAPALTKERETTNKQTIALVTECQVWEVSKREIKYGSLPF